VAVQAPDGPYYWLLAKLGLYRPQTWEYSRSNVTKTVMSKRKLHQLVEDGAGSVEFFARLRLLRRELAYSHAWAVSVAMVALCGRSVAYR
jgi:glutamyl/glutaminyl-tRNA synthetase